MKPIAIIPARGGSKRLPRKNILPIAGRPMISYPICSLRDSHLFSRIIVSTEDNEIADIAIQERAEVIPRDVSLATDTSTVSEVCRSVLSEENYHGLFCCVYPTAIFLSPADFIDSYNLMLESSDKDCVLGVSKYNLHAFQAMQEDEGFLKPMWPEFINRRSQTMPLLAPNGTLHWADSDWFLENKSYYSGSIKGYEIPYYKAIDIDTHDDYVVAAILKSQL